MFGTIEKMRCFLCSKEADRLPQEGATHHVFCKNCGEYEITIQAERVLEVNQYDDIKYILSSQTFENYYYKQKPLTIKADHIQNAKDISLVEKLFKLSKYLYYETKKRGEGSKIDDIRYSQVYCRNYDGYIQLLETLKSKNIIDIEKTKGNIADIRKFIYTPMLLGSAILAFEEGIENIEDFRKAFMEPKNGGNQINIQGDNNQLIAAAGNSNIDAIQNSSLDIAELNTLIENIIKAIPHNISVGVRNEISDNLEFIKTEIQSPNPRKNIIKNTFTALKAIAGTAEFIAALTQLATFLGL